MNLSSIRALCTCALALSAAACTPTGTTASNTPRQQPANHYKMSGNRSADPLGNYSDDNPNSVNPGIDGRYSQGAQGNGLSIGAGRSRTGPNG